MKKSIRLNLSLVGFCVVICLALTIIINDNLVSAKNSQVNITKNNIPVEKIKILDGNLTVEKGNLQKLNVFVGSSDATSKQLISKSANENIVTVSQTGEVTGIKEGTLIYTN